MADGSGPLERTRKPDPLRTREDILRVARDEFAEHGLAGARVDAIAAGTRTTKRMIYYYFGSKEGLYLEVLQRAYGDLRTAEVQLDLATLPPADAVRRLLVTSFDVHEANPRIVRLISNENLYNGKFLKASEAIRNVNASVIDTTSAILERGLREGVFRNRVDPIDLHMMVSAYCFFRVSNRATFGTLFGIDLASDEVKARQKQMLCDAVLALLGYRGL